MRLLQAAIVACLAISAGCATSSPSSTLPVPSALQEPPLESRAAPEGALPSEAESEVSLQEEEPLDLEPVATVQDLCEPVDSRRAFPTYEERQATIAHIEKVCDAMGVDEKSCIYFSRIVALRESSYRSWVRHKLKGDVGAAAQAYLRKGDRFGWSVHWSKKDRKYERTENIVLTPLAGREQNPYYVEVERWVTGGLGLGGLNVTYHLLKFDPMAPPEILCDPTINIMVQIFIARSAVERYGARNWYEVQAVYGGRTYTYYDSNGRKRRKALSCWNGCSKEMTPEQRKRAWKGDAAIRKRCRDRHLDCESKPVLGTVLGGKDVTVHERYEFAEQLRGEPLPDFGGVTPTVKVE